MRTLVLLVIYTCCFWGPAGAQWSQNEAPDGGRTIEIVQTSNYLWVSAGNGGLFRSENNGDTWESSVNGLPDRPIISALTSHNNSLYVGVNNHGIYRSDDEGASWVAINNGVQRVIFDVIFVSGNQIFASSILSIYYSDDNGTTWEQRDNGISDLGITAFEEFDGRFYVSGTSFSASKQVLLVTDDNGLNWLPVAIDEVNTDAINAMLVYDNVFYIEAKGKIFASTDTTATWRDTLVDAKGDILSIKASADSVYATSLPGTIHYTTDQGDSWITLENSMEPGEVWDAILLNDKMIMSTDRGLYVSSDGGSNWLLNNKGIKTSIITTIASTDQWLFLGTREQGVFKSDDNGATWERANQGLIGSSNLDIRNILNFGGRLILATNSAIYTSDNWGESWNFNFDPGENAGIDLIGYGNGIIAAGSFSKGVYISTDSAATWTLASTQNFNVFSNYFDIEVLGDTILVANFQREVYLTTNRGADWVDVSIDKRLVSVRDIQYVDSLIYASTNKGVYTSSDLGNNWVPLVNDEERWVYDILPEEDRLIAGTWDGVYVYSLKRQQWQAFNDSMKGLTVNKLHRIGETVYAGTFDASVWKRSLAEFSFDPIITDITLPSAIAEEDTLDFNLIDLVVDDPDNDFPNDFTLTVLEGENYVTTNDNNIVPAVDYNGDLTVDFLLTDVDNNSDTFNIEIMVTPVNDRPIVTTVRDDLTAISGEELPILLEYFHITDPDNDFPQDFTLNIKETANYTVVNNSVISDVDFSGTLNVVVSVSDGDLESEEVNLPVEITQITSVEGVVKPLNISVFPNPTNETLYVNLANAAAGEYQYTIYNVIGRQRYDIEPAAEGSSVSRLDIKNFPGGLYLLEITNGKTTEVVKFSKQ